MFYTGCSYRGEMTRDGKRFDGQGVYTFSNGDTYVGAFQDGRMHGYGTLFFTRERGGGQYRGVWENGRNVSGAFVFLDGLVYGSEENTVKETGINKIPDTDGLATMNANINVTNADSIFPSVTSSATADPGNSRLRNLASNWLYCREGDRRLWAEHLREVMPVLPLQAILGGMRVPQSSCWAAEPVVAPSVAAEAKTPATFAQGQPRSLADVPEFFWMDAVQREHVVLTTRLPTPPFRGAQGGAGREETMTDDGGRPAMNLSLRIIVPLESEAMRRAIASAASAPSPSSSSPPKLPVKFPDVDIGSADFGVKEETNRENTVVQNEFFASKAGGPGTDFADGSCEAQPLGYSKGTPLGETCHGTGLCTSIEDSQESHSLLDHLQTKDSEQQKKQEFNKSCNDSFSASVDADSPLVQKPATVKVARAYVLSTSSTPLPPEGIAGSLNATLDCKQGSSSEQYRLNGTSNTSTDEEGSIE